MLARSALRHLEASHIRHYHGPVARFTTASGAVRASRRRPVASLPAFTSRAQVRQASRLSNYFANLRQVGRDQMEQSPIMFPFALFMMFSMTGLAFYVAYLYMRMEQRFANYPENVGLKLRRALYFVDHQPDFGRALKAFVQAIKLSEEEDMHPLSKEVLGIYIEIARLYEKHGQMHHAIEILENSRIDCLKWIDKYGNDEGAAPTRSRLLQSSISFAHKIGELYSTPYHADREKAEQYLTWAVDTIRKENERRAKEGLKPGEGTFFTADEEGASLESLGHHFEANDNHYFAGQLFLQALRIKPTKDCHTVILMNNISACLAQQAPPPEPNTPPPSPAELRASARVWAKRSLELAQTIKPPIRNEECDQGCAVATHNLGEFAEMDGNLKEARELYEEAGSLAHAIGFREGVTAADAAIKRIDGGNPKKRYAPKKKSTSWWS